MRDKVVLNGIIIEDFQQDLFSVAHGQSLHQLLQQIGSLLSKVLIEEGVVAGLVADIAERAQTCELFVELVVVSEMDECLEVAKRHGYDMLASIHVMGQRCFLASPSTCAITSHCAIVRVLLWQSLVEQSVTCLEQQTRVLKDDLHIPQSWPATLDLQRRIRS